ncbi:MAG: TrmB family transcriptional regulator [Candidatus Woesearchaeota archaeon]
MNIEELQKFGLSKQEATIYIALLQSQEALVSEIAQKTGYNRSSLYTILDQMTKKSFITYIVKNNIRYYRATEPSRILVVLKEKERAFLNILPELNKLHKPRDKKPIIEILEGKEGIKTLVNDILRQKKTWYAYTSPGRGINILGAYTDVFEKERQKAKITLNVIVLKTKLGYKRAKEFKKMKYTNIRYMPEIFDSPSTTWIYGDRIAVCFWYEEYPFAMRIIDRKLAETQKHHFDMLWNHAEKM